MAASLQGLPKKGGAGGQLAALVAARGSAAHPFARSEALRRGVEASRNLADTLHFLSTVYGRHPGAVDRAAAMTLEPDARAWLADAANAFSSERALLARLAAAAGPVPSTPGASDSDVALLGLQVAVETLGQSERRGCSLGAALALLIDWTTVRETLEVAATRFGVEPPPLAIDLGAIDALVNDLPDPVRRAMMFGAEQLALHQHGLWDLLEARAEARAG